MKIKRTFWHSSYLSHRNLLNDGRQQTDEEEANLVSSLLEDGRHAPVIDLDFPIKIVPSSTNGHYHLYLEKPITWKQYRSLLRGFYKSGLIEWTAYIRGIQRGQTFVRKPGIAKSLPMNVGKAEYFFTYFKVYAIAYAKLIKWKFQELLK